MLLAAGILVAVTAVALGAWRMARHPVMHQALNNRTLQRYGFLCFSHLVG